MTAVIPLASVAVASAGFDQVADASPVGRPGTVLACAVLAVVALAGTVLAWRGTVGSTRTIAAAVLFLAAAVAAALTVFLLIAAGSALGAASLTALATVSLAMIGRALLQAAPHGPQR
ncbi:hypothetical protein [Mangrovihabitans endophyticus]|uniref:hypothetical protein n=1 Tax=Mangrovihabitans endophyticus TaxID=1751298 RepID=UPI0016631B20|nr:hypothetical protein [Mangrovihabitans endophyticus]